MAKKTVGAHLHRCDERGSKSRQVFDIRLFGKEKVREGGTVNEMKFLG